ncbi:sushi, von Willebrand factor type A, EGF and pentraxin domain-containing protein 1-like, partial [Stegodyphus dumicola]|uniref:sushi, von Willebrand factor type A, EGF and pentraxin domain-containing protein 1-like n=1 Tax=Stegodyphus dumicola TaxID=202533 RepID=UPI0015A799FB
MLFIAFAYFTFVAILAERVPIDEKLGTFLGTLERYAPNPNDVVFLLDESGSIGAERFEHVKLFTELIVRRLPVSSEYTRVAIVTFATEPRTHVNYIRDSLGNNMCTLLRSIKHIDYAAEWTHTKEAMIEARNILRSARLNSTKIIILLTDGQSNDGHNPVSVAKELKNSGVIIFSVGVAEVNVEEVKEVATSLDHMYILSDFSYIETVNKHLINDTVEVSWDYTKDTSLCNTYCDSGSDCCDNNAKCYCGTKGGQYECVCNAGHFGSGHKHKCHLCPKGTYKADASKQPCIPCPENFTTIAEGSSSFSDCICLNGYQRHGNFCKPIECAKLSAPDGGVLVPSRCEATYGMKCTFKCKEGFCPYSCNATDLQSTNDFPWHHLPTQSRECLESGKWSGVDFHCE